MKKPAPKPIQPMYRPPSKRGGRGNPRELTVNKRYIDTDAGEQCVPLIRMSGRWLQRLGFKSGRRIVVTTERKRLVLTITRAE